MSERWQKVFTWVVWIAIFALIIFFAVRWVHSIEQYADNQPITETEWIAMLLEGFGNSALANDEPHTEEVATGSYLAITSIDAIGTERMQNLTGITLTSDEDKINAALEYGIITEKQLEKEVGATDANTILLNALDLYFDPAYYPEYCEIESNADVINADKWDITEIDADHNTMTAVINGTAPEIGELFIYTDEYGIAQARYIDAISQTDDNTYFIQTSMISDPSEVMDSISFSGSADFGYLLKTEDSSESSAAAGKSKMNPFVVTAYAAETDSILVAEWEWFEDKTALKKEKTEDIDKCDIEFNVEIKTANDKKEKKDKGSSLSAEGYVTLKTDAITEEYKLEDGELSETTTVNGLPNFEFSEEEKKSDTVDTDGLEEERGVGINIKLEGFSVCTSGYYQWSDPGDSKNCVEVLASVDKVSINVKNKMSLEEKVELGSLKIPIAATYGTISIELRLFLIMEADGTLELWYEIENPYTGVNVSVENGWEILHGSSDSDSGIKAEFDISGGFSGQAAIQILGTKDLADPSVDVKANASLSKIDLEDGYKLKEEYSSGNFCSELTLSAPTVTLNVSEDGSSLYNLLDILGIENTSFDIIDEDHAIVKKTYHVEEDGGKFTVTELKKNKKHKDICTHIEKIPADAFDVETVKKDASDKVEKAEEDVQSEFESALDAAIEKWMLENCGDCY